jgi:hypothetical protein
MKKMIFLIAALIAASAAYADCDNPRDDFDGLYCLNLNYS